MLNTDVLIAGAGPVGLTVAMDLAARGHKVCVVEIRAFGQPPNVKCNHVSSRTMERFRRLGIAATLRAAGLPADYPNDVVFRTSVLGQELTRIPIPGRSTRYTDHSGPDGWWPTPEPPHRINQIYLEPLLLQHAAAQPNITIINRSQITGFVQDDEGVLATLIDLDSKQAQSIQCRYLIGCDGGASTIRRAIGGRLEGTPVIQSVQSTYIRAPQLRGMLTGKPAWSYYSVNPRRSGTVFAIDGEQTWLVHNHLLPHEKEFDAVDRDWSIRQILGVDENFEYDIISKEDWVGRRLVATKFREGKVFIAGDAAHLWVPYAGYGMNAGIADGLNLSWLLSARLQGWGSEAMLDAYEAERQPITEQVSNFAMNHAAKMIKARSSVPSNLEDDNAAGAAERQRIGQECYDVNVEQFCCAGLNFGYYYQGSPIIIGEEEAPPAYSMGNFQASTVPGCRAPHFWLADGRSLYDAFGQGYTLLRLDPQVPIDALTAEARQRGIALTVLDIDRSQQELPDAYRHALLLCRDDQHVAWRAQHQPAKPGALWEQLTGHTVARTPAPQPELLAL